jgi:hypothetical protein
VHRRMRKSYKISFGKSEDTRALEDLGMEGKMILKYRLGKLCLEVWIAFIWL